ncbi:F-box/RNI-like/FBD-like domains-containing protein [Rhynchospora pubera]|uniref:F-box/RNI-like/FBD-like domains-containing protein n=1 Tax=Rhynchospora pubera TaxID=906938 RepID=A0AAV8EPF4_9POAL|nr:F-box/RNI-like/FBD-like domains-containing protein [Rhynchospora pubera]
MDFERPNLQIDSNKIQNQRRRSSFSSSVYYTPPATPMAMACSQTDANQIDLFSILSDDLLITILSFLPTRMAARATVLCCRFHRLYRRFRFIWEASHFLQLINRNPSHLDKFIAVADHDLLHRNSLHSLHSLYLELYDINRSLPDSYVPSLLEKARSLGLCHLTIVGSFHFAPVLPIIFTIETLKSLSLPNIGRLHMFPSGVTLTCLRSLSIGLASIDPTKLNQLLSELCSLEDLHLDIHSTRSLSLSSQTIRKLELIIGAAPRLYTLGLFLPSLGSLHLENRGFLDSLFCIHGEVPLLRKALISLHGVHAGHAGAVRMLLSCISHVEELSLHVKEDQHMQYPVPILLEPGETMPKFPNLKHLDVGLCFHLHNFDAIVMMLHNCPSLELLNLVHEIPLPQFTRMKRGRKRKDWGSKLPLNADGNHRYAYLKNLHLGENRKEFIKLLSKKCSSKRHAHK